MNECEMIREKESSLLRPKQVAEILNISTSYAYRLIQLQLIPSLRFGKSVRVQLKDLIEFIESSRIS